MYNEFRLEKSHCIGKEVYRAAEFQSYDKLQAVQFTVIIVSKTLQAQLSFRK